MARPANPILPAAALLTLIAAAAAVAFAASGETGAPALEQDGVWRARGNWDVGDGDAVVHDGEAIEVLGNLTVHGNATLLLVNATLTVQDRTPYSHAVRVTEGAFFELKNATLLVERAGDALVSDGGEFWGERCVLRFNGSSSAELALRAENGRLRFTDCQVQTDAHWALGARASNVDVLDCDFVTLEGEPSDIRLGGSGRYLFDTTRFGTLDLEGPTSATFYSTVRFFLFSPEGAPVAGQVNGTGAYGEFFSVATTPGAPAAVRLRWREFLDSEGSYPPEARGSPGPVLVTAVNASVGGNSTAFWVAAHRTNLSVILDGPFDLGFLSFTVIGKTLEGPPLIRAYYIELDETVSPLIRIQNNGAFPSPQARIEVVRVALDPSSRQPEGGVWNETVLEVPSLARGESWNATFTFAVGTFGGEDTSTTPCTTSVSYTSSLRASLQGGAAGDFAPWNDAREFTVVAFKVEAVPGPTCPQGGTEMLPLLAGGAAAAVVGVGAITYWFAETRVARRAARKRPPDGEGPPPQG